MSRKGQPKAKAENRGPRDVGSAQAEGSARHAALIRAIRNEVRARHRNPVILPRTKGEGVKRGGATR